LILAGGRPGLQTRRDRKRFIVQAEKLLMAFVKLESASACSEFSDKLA
jgi:hypothetical protein